MSDSQTCTVILQVEVSFLNRGQPTPAFTKAIAESVRMALAKYANEAGLVPEEEDGFTHHIEVKLPETGETLARAALYAATR